MFLNSSRSSSIKIKKVKKFNYKKGTRVKVLHDDSHHALVHDSQKVGMEEHGNSRKFCGAITSGNLKCRHNI